MKRNIIKFPGDMMFQLNDDETEDVFKVAKCDLERKNHRGNNIKYNPYVFTEQGIYMLMTVLKGELAISQSIALVRAFKQMKDYLPYASWTSQRNDYSYTNDSYSLFGALPRQLLRKCNAIL